MYLVSYLVIWLVGWLVGCLLAWLFWSFSGGGNHFTLCRGGHWCCCIMPGCVLIPVHYAIHSMHVVSQECVSSCGLQIPQ